MDSYSNEWKRPVGDMAKVAKGFAVAGQPDDAARKRAWKTRKARAKRSPHNYQAYIWSM